jgi:hypothetical protein
MTIHLKGHLLVAFFSSFFSISNGAYAVRHRDDADSRRRMGYHQKRIAHARNILCEIDIPVGIAEKRFPAFVFWVLEFTP